MMIWYEGWIRPEIVGCMKTFPIFFHLKLTIDDFDTSFIRPNFFLPLFFSGLHCLPFSTKLVNIPVIYSLTYGFLMKLAFANSPVLWGASEISSGSPKASTVSWWQWECGRSTCTVVCNHSNCTCLDYITISCLHLFILFTSTCPLFLV